MIIYSDAVLKAEIHRIHCKIFSLSPLNPTYNVNHDLCDFQDYGWRFRLNRGFSRMTRISRIGGYLCIQIVLVPAGRNVYRNASDHTSLAIAG